MKNKSIHDWAIALTVLACSILLFFTLAFALSNRHLGTPDVLLRVNFSDATGLKPNAHVKFAGAAIGILREIRILTPEERAASGDPANAVQLLLALGANARDIPGDASFSISSDTLLSDKFVLISGGTQGVPPLDSNRVAQGIPPTTFDQLTRQVGGMITRVENLLGSGSGEVGSAMGDLRQTLTETRELLAEAKVAITEARSLVGDADKMIDEGRSTLGQAGELIVEGRSLLAENREPLRKAVASLESAATTTVGAAARAEKLIRDNEGNLQATLRDLQVSSQNLKLLTTYGKILTRSLAERPQQIIWGPRRRPNELPSEAEILRGLPPVRE